MKWITSDDLGAIAFQTRAECKAAVPSFRQKRVELAFGFLGWLAVDPYGSNLKTTIQTPDGRKIPVVSGYCESGRVMGMRGGTPKESFRETFRSLMARAIESDLDFNEYKNGAHPCAQLREPLNNL